MILPPPCVAAHLTAYDRGATRHGNRYVATIVLTNDSERSCTISGYPKLLFLLGKNDPERVTLHLTMHDANFTTPGPATTVLQPAHSAAFFLGYPRADKRGNPCDAISTIAIRGFPNGGVLRLPDTITPCSTINVSPYFLQHA